MAIIKCKMCGGDLTLVEGQSVAECEFCGSRQTVPTADNEKKLTLFARANRLRAACDFDKASGIYEAIVADFPEEAEAYWGLVLCKYGIEYVDDPGTGKKIPTCHRSSYDSVMDDCNYEQAMENADVAAQKVYREEAKQFERIRKGILEVSATEKPYDIFICYKETDEKGDRTLDSVLAQDLYSALTDKGYRVFFSRITLQGKLGEAYEPYIFAALNSAKVMLAVGTRYEYYNAVWVKNEWSRYIKICEADKSKHLIPCFKDLDPEDMPKEFNHLQGADLGKMGAIQDILFNMEKYIPLKKQTPVNQERVVVGGSGNNKIASLLDRGNMALEDGDWAKADSFFEDVLNNDSKNAQAYLGKTLAVEKCRTIDAFARKRKEASQNVRGQKLTLAPNTAHIDQKVAQFSIPGYVEDKAIRSLYEFDLSYYSDVPDRKQQYRNEENYWINHKQLSRAEQFAAGAVAENLRREKNALFAALSERIKKAEAAEAAQKAKVQDAYNAHIAEADVKAEQIYEAGLKRREKLYQELLATAKNSTDMAKLRKAAEQFERLGSYQDSKNLAAHCRKRVTEIQAQQDAAAEAARIQREKEYKARKARNKKISILVVTVLVALIAFVIVLSKVIIPAGKYNDAMEMMDAGMYAQATDVLQSLGSFRNSEGKIVAMKALNDLERQNYDEAVRHILSAGEPVEIHYTLNGGQLEGGTAQSYEKSADFAGVGTAEKLGYRFVGWDLVAYQYVSGERVTIQLSATWSDGFMIKYELDGGSADNPTEYHKDGAAVAIKDPTKQGYTFLGWTGTDLSEPTKNLTIPAGSYGDRVYTANWEKNGIITYYLGGGQAGNITEYSFLDGDFTLNNPTRSGYTFIGWTGTDLTELTMKVTIPSGSHGDRNYTANWKANDYTFTLNANGGSVSPSTITAAYDSSYTLPTPQRDYYTFGGWYSGTKKYTSGTWEQASDLTLTAKWTPTSYTITYQLNGGTNDGINPRQYTVESSTCVLRDAIKKGYKFMGWYRDSSFKEKVTEIPKGSHENITLYAKWEINTYTITYQMNGGSVSGTLKTKFTINDLPLTLPKPTRADYVFLGWKLGGFDGADISSITECQDITVYAMYLDSYLQMEKYTPYSWSSEEPYYIVKKYAGSATEVDIPAMYEGYPVKEISSSAFSGNKTIVTINIPNTIESLGSGVFKGCTAIRQIFIPSSVTSIGSTAFNGCTALESIQLPDSVTSIGASAFEGCSSLSSIQLPSRLSTLGNSAFEDCTSLRSVVIPGSLKELDYCTFRGCTNLEKVTLNEGLEEISFGAFGSEKLTELIIPKSVTYIHSEAFNYGYSNDRVPCSNVIFYCRANSMPSNWQTGWNNGRPIIWGYDESTFTAPTYNFVTNGGTSIPSQTTLQVLTAPVSKKTGYVLVGWYDNSALTGDPVEFPYYSASKTILYAKWMPESEYYNGTTMQRAYRIGIDIPYLVPFETNGQKIYYRFVPSVSRTYTITSSEKPAIYCYLYDVNGTSLDWDSASSYSGHIELSYSLVAGQEYYIMIKPYSNYSLPTVPVTFIVQ